MFKRSKNVLTFINKDAVISPKLSHNLHVVNFAWIYNLQQERYKFSRHPLISYNDATFLVVQETLLLKAPRSSSLSVSRLGYNTNNSDSNNSSSVTTTNNNNNNNRCPARLS
ncbi:hypothetical protein ElyMa_004514500 [Elysia marginata]|uniref:BRCT domain-containing protein n=1 Tax=Elysia marginata TaxID=1093978 RepID=A0AAV4HP04_9GAST|nr:hypothetical protein ElyMa_004514500 [Elysia marginata]